MEEVVVAEVDTNVRESSAHGVEEYEIAGLQLTLVDNIAYLALFPGCAWQKQAERIFVDQLNEAAAIESTFSTGATTAVVDTNQLQALEDQVLGAACVAFKQRRFIAEPWRLFDGLNRTDARKGDKRNGKQDCDEFITRHGGEI